MRTMKDSGIEWIGEIPQEWELTRVGLLFKTIGSGTTPSSSDSRFYDGKYNWLQTGDLNDDIIKTTEKTITDQAIEKYSVLKQYSIGSLVIAMYGATIGKLGMLNIPCYTNQACCVLEEPINLDTRFVYYWFLCNRQNLITLSLGGGQPNISQNTIRSLKICLPSKVEQGKIVTFLDQKCVEIDTLITTKEKNNALLKERRQSIIYEAVTKGLNLDAPLKDSGIEWIGQIPEEWNTVCLKRLGMASTGSTPSKDHPEYWDGDIPWVSPKDMKTDYLIDSEDHITEAAVSECGLTVFDENALLFCVRSGILRHTFPVCVTRQKVTINQDLRAMTLVKKVLPSYLLYYLRGINDVIVTLYQKVGATVESIEMDWFIYLPVVLPSIIEQAEIANYLKEQCERIDAVILKNNETIAKLKEYRQSLIYEAVTGKIEV